MGPIRPASAADWAIVTGASSGLGRELALALAERGRSVLSTCSSTTPVWQPVINVASQMAFQPMPDFASCAFLTVAGRFAPRAALRRTMGQMMRPSAPPSSPVRRGSPA
jgi:NAD(P)-dependent dehydrogenase (short-subunit alcohol dehydrogenase family)